MQNNFKIGNKTLLELLENNKGPQGPTGPTGPTGPQGPNVNSLQYSFSMERSDFPEPFYIAGVFSDVSSNEITNYTTAFSARNNHILLTINSITPVDSNSQCSIKVTGTKVNESTKVADKNFTETITFDASNNIKYKSLAKFYNITLHRPTFKMKQES